MMDDGEPSTSGPARAGRQVHDRLAAAAGRLVLVGYDAVSIAITTFKVSDVAAQAASDGASWSTGTNATWPMPAPSPRPPSSADQPDLKLGQELLHGSIPRPARSRSRSEPPRDTFALGRLGLHQATTRTSSRPRPPANPPCSVRRVNEPVPRRRPRPARRRRGPRRVRHRWSSGTGSHLPPVPADHGQPRGRP